jgi:hypothetical protein
MKIDSQALPIHKVSPISRDRNSQNEYKLVWALVSYTLTITPLMNWHTDWPIQVNQPNMKTNYSINRKTGLFIIWIVLCCLLVLQRATA